MKLDKAIKILHEVLFHVTLPATPDEEGAIKLGIAAIKRLQTMRSYKNNQAILPLPGERPIDDLSPSADRKKKLRESPLGRPPGA